MSIEQVVTSFLIAIATSVVTVWLALKRFYREKWWEARMRAYGDMILALHYMKRDVAIRLDAAYERPHGGGELHNPWSEKAFDAQNDLLRHRDASEFIVSHAAVELVDWLGEELRFKDSDRDLVATYERADEAIRKSIEEMKKIARKDLRFPK